MRVGRPRIGMSVALLAATVGAGSAEAGPSGGALPPQLIQVLSVAGRYGVPDDVSMVAVNVTVVNTLEPGFVTVFACDEDEPPTSNVNYLADQVVPNLVMSRVSSDGTICVATSAVTDAIVDIVGYVPSGSAVIPLAAPVRRLDTREPGGPPSPVPAGTTTEVPITGLDGVPTDATLVMFNATAIGGGDPGFVTAFPCGDLPGTSSVNHVANQIVANFVTSRISATGTICVFNLAAADVIIDVVGYATGGVTPLATPQRLVDTRVLGSAQPSSGTLTLDITGRADVPDDATAAVYNLTSVEAAGPGFATSYPCDVPIPGVSNLNYAPGQVVANGAITKLSAAGELCIFNLAATHLIVDLIGYARGADDYVPITPQRIWDSREGWQRTCPWIFRGSLNNETITLRNLETGETRSVVRPTPPGLPLQTRPLLNNACTALLWLQDTYFQPPAGLYQLDFDGASRLLLPTDPSLSSLRIADIVEMPNGDLLGVSETSVVDLRSGVEVTLLPPPPMTRFGSQLLALDASASGVIARLTGTIGVVGHLETFDLRTGELIGRLDLDSGVYGASLSPDGTYVAFTDTGKSGDSDDDVLLVSTVFGDIVDGLRGPSIVGRFWGNGSLVVCAADRALFEWDLYGPVRQLAVTDACSFST